MPETPDFVTLAVKVLGRDDLTVGEAVAVFKGIWNGRGAADAEAVESRIRELVAGEVVGAGIARHVAAAIRQLDR